MPTTKLMSRRRHAAEVVFRKTVHGACVKEVQRMGAHAKQAAFLSERSGESHKVAVGVFSWPLQA